MHHPTVVTSSATSPWLLTWRCSLELHKEQGSTSVCLTHSTRSGQLAEEVDTFSGFIQLSFSYIKFPTESVMHRLNLRVVSPALTGGIANQNLDAHTCHALDGLDGSIMCTMKQTLKCLWVQRENTAPKTCSPSFLYSSNKINHLTTSS